MAHAAVGGGEEAEEAVGPPVLRSNTAGRSCQYPGSRCRSDSYN
jgi:hypothetical protein